MQHHANQILDMNPRHPLPATAEPTAHSHPKGSQHRGESPAVRSENDPNSDAYHANTKLLGRHRFAFPIHAEFREESIART